MNTKKTWVSFAVTAACLLFLGGAAKAQDSKMQVFGGYSFGTNNCFGTCFIDPGLHGYTAAFAYKLNRHIALEADFSGHNGTPTVDHEDPTSGTNGFTDKLNQNIYVYTFGPRFSLPVGDFSLFSHVLVGAAHLSAKATSQCISSTGGEETCGTSTVVTNETWSSNGFATKVGGGVDWNHKRWGIRILEVDYIHGELFSKETCVSCSPQFKESFDASGNAFEMSTGVTFNFGGMK